MSDPKKPTSPFASVGGIAGAIGGWALAQYCGAAFWVPGAAALLLFLFFTKTSLRPRAFLGAITVTGAHLLWFLVGSAMAGSWSSTAMDLALLSAGVIWLWLRPGLASAIFLGVIQLVSLLFNGLAWLSVNFGEAAHRALTTHCIFRLIAIVCLVVGYRRWRQERSAAIALDGAEPGKV